MSTGSLKVKIFDAKGTNVVPVAKSTVTVGSSAHCDVVLEHDTVQGEHVRAWLEGGRIWIQDLGTSGGTFLNGIRLPPLKPMLVRDLDILKLGECPATLGLEATLVRAPIVKSQPVMEEVTLTDIRPLTAKDPELEKRRDELAKVSRELAELKLQLQMGRLEKNSTEEIRKQINSLREELRQLNEQREKAADSIKRLENDKHARISSTEAEIVEMKIKADRDVREMRDAQGRKLGHWKVDAVADLSKQLHQITLQKMKAWTTRPLSQDMMFEWESDLNQMIRRVLLEEGGPQVNSDHTNTEALVPKVDSEVPAVPSKTSKFKVSGTTKENTSSTSTSTSASTRTKTKSRSKIKDDTNWSRIGLSVICVAFLGVVGWVAKPYIGRSAVRGLASQTPANAASPSNAKTARPAARYQPKQNRVFKKTYTENVLFTESYGEVEMSKDFRQRWLADLAKSARGDWKLDEKSLSDLIAKEQQLIADLHRLRDSIQVSRESEGIGQMRARETAFNQELLSLLKSPATVEKFQRLKRSFFTKNAQALTK